MRLRVITGLAAVGVCVVLVVYFGLNMPIANGSKDRGSTGAVSPAKGGFRDVLNTPAEMSSLASKRQLTSIASAGKRVVSVGPRGHIVYSDDEGKNWTQAKVPVSVDLTAVYFPSAMKGWAVGHDGVVLHSSDGGATWVKQLDGNETCRIMKDFLSGNAQCRELQAEGGAKLKSDMEDLIAQGPVTPFLDVWFKDENDGFAVGAFNMIFHTSDGGKTWESWYHRTENPGGLHFYSVRPCGRYIFLSGEQGWIWRLDKESGRFHEIKTPYIGTLFGIIGKGNLLLTFGQRGNLYSSLDYGATWNKVESGVSGTIFGGTTTEDGGIVLVTQNGNIILSKNDAKSFTEIKHKEGDVPEYAVTSLGKDTLVVAGMLGPHTLQLNGAQSNGR